MIKCLKDKKFQRKNDSSWYQPYGHLIYATYVGFFLLPPTLCPDKQFWILRLTAVCYASAETIAKKLEGSFYMSTCKFYHGLNLFQMNCQLNSVCVCGGGGKGINLGLTEARCWYEGHHYHYWCLGNLTGSCRVVTRRSAHCPLNRA